MNKIIIFRLIYETKSLSSVFATDKISLTNPTI